MSLELISVVSRVGAEIHIHPTSLKLEAGVFNILLGPTQAGKTSLMQLMAGLVKPTSGEVWFNGRNVTGVPVRKRNVSMVYQQFINYGNFTVSENIASPLRVAGVKEPEVGRRVGEIAELLRLTPMLGRRPAELSGGQQQRTAIARALVKDADLILLDEPLANLDYKLREELRDELPKLFRGRGATVVYATTEPGEALLLGGNTATLNEGRVTEFGPTGTVYRRPQHLISAQVFSDPPINVVPVTKVGAGFDLGGEAKWRPDAAWSELPEGSYLLGLRPHHITPVRTSHLQVKLTGRVLVTELSGSESIVHFDLGGRTWVSQSHGIHNLEIGSEAELFADVGKGLLFLPDGSLVAALAEGRH